MPEFKPFYDTSYALVMGIDQYATMPPLSAAVRGAQNVADALRKGMGFDVTLLTNHDVSRDSVFGWLKEVRGKAGPDDRVLIYFAGHGATRGQDVYERGFLVLPDSGSDDWHTMLAMDDIIEEAPFIKAKHMLYVLDCCFGGLALDHRGAVDSPRELNYYLTRPVRYAISAGGKEFVDDSLAPDGKHSIFTYHLLEWLSDERIRPANGIWRARELGNFLESAVARDRRSGHKPNHNYLSGSGDGDFLFKWETGPRIQTDVSRAILSEIANVRRGGVAELIRMARSDDSPQVKLARAQLQHIAENDPDEEVRRVARSIFEEEDAYGRLQDGTLSQEEAQLVIRQARSIQQAAIADAPAMPQRPASTPEPPQVKETFLRRLVTNTAFLLGGGIVVGAILCIWMLVIVFTALNNRGAATRALAFSPDGSTLIAGHDLAYGHEISLYDTTTRELIAFSGAEDSIDDLAVSDDGALLAGGALYGEKVYVWDLASHDQIFELAGHTDEVTGLAFRPGTHDLISSSRDGTVIYWNLETGGVQTRFTASDDKVTHLFILPDGETIITFSGGLAPANRWVFDNPGEWADTLDTITDRSVIAMSPDGETFAAGSSLGIELQTAAVGVAPVILEQTAGSLRTLAYSPNGLLLASAADPRMVWIWDLTTHTHIELSGIRKNIDALAFSPDGTLLAASGDSAIIYLYDTQTWELLSTIKDN